MSNCNKTVIPLITSPNDINLIMHFLQFIIAVLVPIVGTFGIITNVLVVYTVSYKQNQKDLKENQYKYMRLNAVFNIFILAIEPITLISQCHNYDIGVLCSQIRSLMFSQYFKMIFGEYVSNVFRLAANFSYVVFALNRLSLIGREHGKLVTKASKLKIKGFFLRFFAPCLLLPAVKALRFFPNSMKPDLDYPVPIENYFSEIKIMLTCVFLSFNLLYDFINYMLFLIINFVVDVCLAVQMKQTIAEKQEKNLGSNSSLKK